MSEQFSSLWQYLKDNDAPNWFVIFFSLIVWPLLSAAVVYWSTKRKKQSVPGFIITRTPGQQISIGSQPYPAVLLTFINQTGSIVYLSGAKLKASRKFPIPIAASKDLASGWHELKFALPPNPPATSSVPLVFDEYGCILVADDKRGRTYSAIPVAQAPKDAFYSHKPGVFRRLFRWPKYFRLEYVVMVGGNKISVATIY